MNKETYCYPYLTYEEAVKIFEQFDKEALEEALEEALWKNIDNLQGGW
jgi:hypothetical protein